jgi:hypothetical protein
VFLLRGDVSGNGGHIRLAYAESAVSSLPGKPHVPFLVDPTRGIRFDNARNLRRRLHGTDADEHVDMISSPVDDERSPMHFADDAAEVSEKIITDFGDDERLAIFGAEDQVKDQIAGCVGQVSFAPSELAASFARFPTACAVGCILAPLRG